jgi:RNA-directed DNA polymerase
MGTDVCGTLAESGHSEGGKTNGLKRGTPQGGVIRPLLSYLFLHVVFDGLMQKHSPEKPFERYADDIIV